MCDSPLERGVEGGVIYAPHPDNSIATVLGNFRALAMCNSLPKQAEQGGVSRTFIAHKPPPATAQPAAPLPREGILSAIKILRMTMV